jgi:hypothetical protein
MAASKQNRRALAPLKVLFCAALFVASFVVYWTALSVYEQRFQTSFSGRFNKSPSSRPTSAAPHSNTPPEYADTGGSPVHCTTCNASDGTPPPPSTQDSYSTRDFKRTDEEGKGPGENTNAQETRIQTPAAPRRVQEASPKAISPTDTDLTVADRTLTGLNGVHDAVADPTDAISSDVEPGVPAVQATAFRAPAVPAPAVNIPAFQGPTFRVPAFQGPAYHVPTFQTPAVPPCCVAH